MKRLRSVTESEVIWEFLRNEFHHHNFDRDRDRFARLVNCAEPGNARHDALRRALFYRRRGHMWNQLPRDTQWSQVQLEEADLERLCVLARTHWRKLGAGNCLLRHVLERIRTREFHGVRVIGGTAHGGIEISDVGAKVDAIRSFSLQLARGHDASAVVLIGVDDHAPVTILEGNHRLTAALLASRALLVSQFTVFYGVSPQMARCCWYGSPTLAKMLRYSLSRLRHLGNADADLNHALPPADVPALISSASSASPAADNVIAK